MLNEYSESGLPSYIRPVVFLPAVKAAKLEGVTWHTLRHTFASRLAMNGQSDSTIAALLRHTGTALVQRYAHLSPTHLQEAIEGVAKYGNGKDQEGLTTANPQPQSDGMEYGTVTAGIKAGKKIA